MTNFYLFFILLVLIDSAYIDKMSKMFYRIVAAIALVIKIVIIVVSVLKYI